MTTTPESEVERLERELKSMTMQPWVLALIERFRAACIAQGRAEALRELGPAHRVATNQASAREEVLTHDFSLPPMPEGT